MVRCRVTDMILQFIFPPYFSSAWRPGTVIAVVASEMRAGRPLPSIRRIDFPFERVG